MTHGLTEVPISPSHLGRLKDIARLIFRYGDTPGVRMAGIGPEGEAAPADGKPEDLARDLESMGPTYVKLGQLLSTRPDLLPPAYLDALARLQEGVRPFEWAKARETVEEDLGVRISKAFADFDEEPIAAASLGQVHRAVLRDGRRVAVKVQRPGVQETVRKDLELLEQLASFADSHTEAGRRFAFGALLMEFKKALQAEMDYRHEAENLRVMAANLADFERVLVPLPVTDLTTTRVLTMDEVRGRSLRSLSPMARLEADGRDLLDDLFRAFLEQALVHGLVHADPHPGNIFLTDDRRLALLDMGMTMHIGQEMRGELLRMLLAIGDGDEEETAERAEAMGTPRAGYEREAFRRSVGELVSRTAEAGPRGAQMGRLVMGIARLGGEHGLRPPPELSMIGKTLLNLDGIASLLDPAFDPAVAIREHTTSLTRRRMLESATPRKALGALLDAKDFAEELPRRLNRALEAIGNNDLEVRVHVIDESRILTGLQQMANRITSGLILASLIVGAALLMRVETTLTILGYPVLAVVFYLAAAFGGMALLYRIWRGDRETRREAGEGH